MQSAIADLVRSNADCSLLVHTHGVSLQRSCVSGRISSEYLYMWDEAKFAIPMNF